MLAFLAGCQRAEIRSYTVKRLKTDRTLAALVPVGTTAWFFKLTGANGTVAEREQDFRSLLNSIQIVGDDERHLLSCLQRGTVKPALLVDGTEAHPPVRCHVPLSTGRTPIAASR